MEYALFIIYSVGQAAAIGLMAYFSYKERIERAKLDKAKDLQELEYFTGTSDESPGAFAKEADPILVGIENIPDLE